MRLSREIGTWVARHETVKGVETPQAARANGHVRTREARDRKRKRGAKPQESGGGSQETPRSFESNSAGEPKSRRGTFERKLHGRPSKWNTSGRNAVNRTDREEGSSKP